MKSHIAILGAGLSGLSSAFHISRLHPNVRITLIEKQRKSGGWVQSTRVTLPNEYGSVVLEAGPRTLRPNAQSVLELINLLGLKDELITVPKDSPAAQTRYLYIPPNHGISASGLQQIPSTVLSLLKSPLSPLLIWSVAQEALKLSNRPADQQDESVDSFLRRRFGAQFAETLGSAIVHGIYAADSRSIGVKAALPSLLEAEKRGWGSLVRGMLIPTTKKHGSYDVGDVPKLMEGVSVYSFRDGMQTVTDALEKAVKRQSNVDVVYESPISSVNHSQEGFSIDLADGGHISASHVVSALPTPVLYGLLPSSLREAKDSSASHLVANRTSSVHVVNIVFPGPPSTIHPAGFGYLIPRQPSGYPTTSNRREIGILGTVFDSCSLSAQDSDGTDPHSYHTAKFTKLTMMIGGPYPLPTLPQYLSSAETPANSSEKDVLPEYMQNLLDQLSTHLDCSLPAPLYWRIAHNQDCIPTLSPGHVERVASLERYLQNTFGGRLQVVGAGVGGVSLGDCVEAGRRAAQRLSVE